MHRARLVVALMAVVALIVSACGGSSSSSDTPGGSASEGPPAVARQGGSSTVIQNNDATNLDPKLIINSSGNGSDLMNALYDVLFTVDRDTGELQPRIATDLSSPDGTTWTLKLRSDVTFTDGTPLDAAAVKHAWERVAADPRANGWSHMQYVDTMTVVDPTTMQFTLTEPNRQFHHGVEWYGMVWIPSPAGVAAHGDAFGQNPVGAGPFKLQSRTQGAETVLVRNESYWQPDQPKLDQLTFRTVIDPQQAVDTLLSGAADAVLSMPDTYVLQAEDAGMRAEAWPQQAGQGWLFGQKRPPFDDVRARKAVYLAADIPALLDQVAQGSEPIRSLFREDSPFHDPDVEVPQHDREEAQRLLDELAAEGKPLRFTIVTPAGDSQTRSVALQTQLAAYDNLQVDVEVLDGSTYGITLYQGDFDLATFAITGPDPEPAFFSMSSQHPRPIASIGSPAADAALTEGRTAPDLAGRKAAYDKFQQAFNDSYGLLFTNVNKAWAVLDPKVTGLVHYSMGSHLFHEYGLAE